MSPRQPKEELDSLRASKEARWGGEISTGPRRDFVAKARAMATVAGAKLKAELASDEDVQRLVGVIRHGASKEVMDRTCIRLNAELLNAVGQEHVLRIEFARELGASSEDEARRAVEMWKSVGDVDQLTTIERLTAALEGLLPLHEAHRSMVVRRLGGMVPVEPYDREPVPGA